jgi:hypothetical protein
MAIMLPSLRKGIKSRAVLMCVTAVAELLFIASWANSALAHLSRCTLLQQQQQTTRCDRPGISSASSLETTLGFPGYADSTKRQGTIPGLPDLAKPRPHYVHMDSLAEPMTPPIEGVRDYLNRLDAADSI